MTKFRRRDHTSNLSHTSTTPLHFAAQVLRPVRPYTHCCLSFSHPAPSCAPPSLSSPGSTRDVWLAAETHPHADSPVPCGGNLKMKIEHRTCLCLFNELLLKDQHRVHTFQHTVYGQLVDGWSYTWNAPKAQLPCSGCADRQVVSVWAADFPTTKNLECDEHWGKQTNIFTTNQYKGYASLQSKFYYNRLPPPTAVHQTTLNHWRTQGVGTGGNGPPQVPLRLCKARSDALSKTVKKRESSLVAALHTVNTWLSALWGSVVLKAGLCPKTFWRFQSHLVTGYASTWSRLGLGNCGLRIF